MTETVIPRVVATLATWEAAADLRTLLFSLQLFNEAAPPTVYLYCDSKLEREVVTWSYRGRLVTNAALDLYAGMNRQEMEKLPGAMFDSLWFDFMAEKISLLEWAIDAEAATPSGSSSSSPGVLFCDADICFFAPLPAVPVEAELGVSQHMIRPLDEARYGRYNGGFLWVRNTGLLDVWRKACVGARFYEQSAIEDMANAAARGGPKKLYEFPKQHNYGWWRMWQTEAGPAAAQQEWTMNRRKDPEASGILVAGAPLVSVHTHFQDTRDLSTARYNDWVLSWLQRLEHSHTPARRLLGWLRGSSSGGR